MHFPMALVTMVAVAILRVAITLDAYHKVIKARLFDKLIYNY